MMTMMRMIKFKGASVEGLLQGLMLYHVYCLLQHTVYLRLFELSLPGLEG